MEEKFAFVIRAWVAEAPSGCFHTTFGLLWTVVPTNTHFSRP